MNYLLFTITLYNTIFKKSTFILYVFCEFLVLVILYSTNMKFWVILLWWYTLIQTEKFRMVLHDTVEKKSKKLLDPGEKKISSLIVSWTIHFILNYYVADMSRGCVASVAPFFNPPSNCSHTCCQRGSSQRSRSPYSGGSWIPQPLYNLSSHR